MTLLYGIALAVLLWWLSKVFVRSDTAALAKMAKTGGGVIALGGAAILGMKGQIGMALLLGSFGAWALGWSVFDLPGPWRRFKGASKWRSSSGAGRSRAPFGRAPSPGAGSPASIRRA